MAVRARVRLDGAYIPGRAIVYPVEMPAQTAGGLELLLANVTVLSIHVILLDVATGGRTTISNSLSNLWCGEVTIGGAKATVSRTYELQIELT